MASRARDVLAALALSSGLLIAPQAHAESSGTTVHVVESGDTLWQIAQDAGTDVATLRQLNDLQDDDVLSLGQTLKLTAALAPTKPATYTVSEGDTLSSIAVQLGTTTAALADANQLDDPDKLKIGTQLILPGASAPSSRTTAPSAPSDRRAPSAAARRAVSGRQITVTYTVQSGETLSQIARQFDVRWEAIAQASGLDDPNRIVAGAVLKVPLPGYEHVVKAGETL